MGFALGLLAGCELAEVGAVDLVDAAVAAPTDAQAAADASVPDAPPEDLDGFVTWHMEQGGIPGLAVGMVVDGEVAFTGTWGWADIEAERPVVEDTAFAVASISKLFTGVPLMRLVEEGRLDLDAATEDAFGFRLVHPAHPESPITTRQLLTHSSGLVDDWLALGQTTYEGEPPLDLGEFARAYAQPGGEFYGDDHFGGAPGTDWEYCNAGFAIAGHLAELGWDEDFRALTRRQIFEPLGLEDTGWFYADVDPAKRATLYGYSARPPSYAASDPVNFAHYPAGGLRSSVRDLLRYARAWLAEGELDGRRFLEADTVRGMFLQQVPELNSRQALVLRYDVLGGRTYIGHSGAGIGGSANFLMDPGAHAALIVLTNSDAYVRARFGLTSGREALDAILERFEAGLRARIDG